MIVTLLTVPAVVFSLMQACALGVLVLTWRDDPVPAWLGFTGFGVAVAAFVFSGPALATLFRSDIHGLPRYMLMVIHVLWLVIGGLILLAALCIKIIFPLYARWVGA